MGGVGRSRGDWRRTLFVLALAYLFAVHSISSAFILFGPSNAAADFEAALAASICAHADDGAAPAPAHKAPAPTHRRHCAQCAEHAGCGGRAPAVVLAANALWPPVAAAPIAILAVNASATPHPQSGRGGSWSPRSPPFDA